MRTDLARPLVFATGIPTGLLVGIGIATIVAAQSLEHGTLSNRQRAEQLLVRLAAAGLEDGQRVIAGQNLGHSNFDPAAGYAGNVGRIVAYTGKLPVILAADYGFDELVKDFSPTNRVLEQHARRGGIVSLSMHPPNPWHGSTCHDTQVGNLRELFAPGHPAHERWMQTLDHVASGLAALRDAGVMVLWRPLHEMNGGWFWWGAEHNGKWVSVEEYVAMWRHMHQYFTREKELDNLLWVYAAAVRTSADQKSAVHYYPGDAFVDVVGLDWYADDLEGLDDWQSYTQLINLDKPLGLTEFGPQQQRDGTFDNTSLLRALVNRYPRVAYFVYWHSWPGARVAMIDQRGTRSLLGDPRVESLHASDN